MTIKINDIDAEWSIDCKIDKTSLDDEAIKVCELHNKYYKYYSQAKYEFKKLENYHKTLVKLKTDYYLGKLSDEDYSILKWPVNNKIILKTDLQLHLDSDKHIQESLLQLCEQETVLNYLETIIKSVQNRNFSIKNAIDFLKWTQGST